MTAARDRLRADRWPRAGVCRQRRSVAPHGGAVTSPGRVGGDPGPSRRKDAPIRRHGRKRRPPAIAAPHLVNTALCRPAGAARGERRAPMASGDSGALSARRRWSPAALCCRQFARRRHPSTGVGCGVLRRAPGRQGTGSVTALAALCRPACCVLFGAVPRSGRPGGRCGPRPVLARRLAGSVFLLSGAAALRGYASRRPGAAAVAAAVSSGPSWAVERAGLSTASRLAICRRPSGTIRRKVV